MEKELAIERLKKVLSVPSHFSEEHRMINFLISELGEIPGLEYHRDRFGSIFVTKGESPVYPLVCAHTDTVHKIQEYVVYPYDSPQGDAFRAYNPKGEMCGIGGDNKTGVFTCLELLRSQEILKAAFFIGEEYGCVGSVMAEPEWFENVGYCMEFDAPDYFWVSHFCSGVKLFDDFGEFWSIAKPIMDNHTDGKTDPWKNNHPYTDVFPLKAFYDFTCLNYSSGYMQMHSPTEYVVIDYVFKAIETAKVLLAALGNEKYIYKSNYHARSRMAEGKQKYLKYPDLEYYKNGQVVDPATMI